MSKTTTKATIDANIKQNGTQAITGQVLNSVLTTMVDDYGAQEEVASLDSKVTDLDRKIGGYHLDISVVEGGYITTSSILNIPLSRGEIISTRVRFDGYVGNIALRGRKTDNTWASLITMRPNETYLYEATEDFLYLQIYSLVASDHTGTAIWEVNKNLSADRDYSDNKNALLEISLKDEMNKKVFNGIGFTAGEYLRTDGRGNADAQGFISDFIPVVLGDKFDYSGKSIANSTCIYVFYGIHGEVISYKSTPGQYSHELIEVADPRVTHVRFGSYTTPPVCNRITTDISMQTYVDGKMSEVNQRIDDLDVNVRPSTIYNLFDKTTATEGYYVKPQNGLLEAQNAYIASDYIPVENGKTYTMPVDPTLFGASLAAKICMYNADKAFIGTSTGTLNGILCTITISDANARFIRTTAYAGFRYKTKWQQSYDTYMVVNSATYPTRYYPFGEIPQYLDGEFSVENNALVNPLFGKSVIFDGDSICNANDDTNKYGWAGRIGTKNRMMWNNFAVGGGTFTKITGKHVISETDYGNANPDYIIIEGGTNDADLIGSIIGGSVPAQYGSYLPTGYTDNFTTDTYCGAIESLFKRLLSTYPKAKIGVIIAQKMGVSNNYTPTGNNRRAYFETLMKLCEKWGIPYINLWDRGRLNPRLSAHYTAGDPESLYTDGQHLTPNGYEVITPMIEDWMKTL